MPEKIAFITGGNRGIGFQTALDLKDVAKVVIGSRNLAQGEAAVEKLRAAGADAAVLEFDVTNPAHHRAAFDYFNTHHGRLDILVNNASISGVPFSSRSTERNASQVPMDLLRRVFETNFFSLVALTNTLLPLIEKSPAGRIVNLSSHLASLTLNADPKSAIYHAKSFAYDASKTALNAYTVHLAYDLRNTAIKVNSAHPGWVRTEMGGPEATLDLRDGARTSVALATLQADGPTGGFFHMGKTLPW